MKTIIHGILLWTVLSLVMALSLTNCASHPGSMRQYQTQGTRVNTGNPEDPIDLTPAPPYEPNGPTVGQKVAQSVSLLLQGMGQGMQNASTPHRTYTCTTQRLGSFYTTNCN